MSSTTQVPMVFQKRGRVRYPILLVSPNCVEITISHEKLLKRLFLEDNRSQTARLDSWTLYLQNQNIASLR